MFFRTLMYINIFRVSFFIGMYERYSDMQMAGPVDRTSSKVYAPS